MEQLWPLVVELRDRIAQQHEQIELLKAQAVSVEACVGDGRSHSSSLLHALVAAASGANDPQNGKTSISNGSEHENNSSLQPYGSAHQEAGLESECDLHIIGVDQNPTNTEQTQDQPSEDQPSALSIGISKSQSEKLLETSSMISTTAQSADLAAAIGNFSIADLNTALVAENERLNREIRDMRLKSSEHSAIIAEYENTLARIMTLLRDFSSNIRERILQIHRHYDTRLSEKTHAISELRLRLSKSEAAKLSIAIKVRDCLKALTSEGYGKAEFARYLAQLELENSYYRHIFDETCAGTINNTKSQPSSAMNSVLSSSTDLIPNRSEAESSINIRTAAAATAATP